MKTLTLKQSGAWAVAHAGKDIENRSWKPPDIEAEINRQGAEMTSSRILRVFPRRTSATPDDTLAVVNETPGLFAPEADEVHVSVAFTYDIPQAEKLAEAWRVTGLPVKIGGPAFNEPGADFVPGRYLKRGYVITSRGCPNRCWFCQVPKREGGIVRELPVTDGWNVLDDNLLACSEAHIRAVFAMLRRQSQRAMFTGGLEAKRMTPQIAAELRTIRLETLFFAYDTPDDWEPLVNAARLLKEAGINPHHYGAYVLIGWPKDTIEAADARLRQVCSLGIRPMAMLFRGRDGYQDSDWMKFRRTWVRPHIVAAKMKEVAK